MDYIVTMDTGDKYLMHYGVVGMKWGKWNPETAARYAGGERSARTVKMTSKAEQHRRKANQFRAKRDAIATKAMRAANKAIKAEDGGLFSGPNEMKAAKQQRILAKNIKKGAKASKKYVKADKKAIKYEVKAYKSDANDSSLGPERRTTRDIKKHRISMEQAKTRTEAKVREALKNEKLKNKAVEDALNGAREHQESQRR